MGVSCAGDVQERNPVGLVDFQSSKQYCTDKLDLKNAVILVKNSDELFRAAIFADLPKGQKVSNVLSDLSRKASHQLEDGLVCGRKNIQQDIKHLMQTKGMNVHVTGGRSVGKSLILTTIINELAEEMSKKNSTTPKMGIIKVNGRQESDLGKALQDVVEKRVSSIVKRLPAMAMGLLKISDLKKIDFQDRSISDCVMRFAETKVEGVSHNVLVLDEANLYFGLDVKGGAARCKDLFEAAVLQTKEKSLMSAFFFYSDLGLPFWMRKMSCNMERVTHTLVIGEPSPQEALDLLQEMGVGQNLRELLVSCYGGHVYMICKQLQDLERQYQHEKGQINLIMEGAANVDTAKAKWEKAGGDYGALCKVLREVAETGFCPMSVDCAMAVTLTATNVCGYLTNSAVEYHVPPSLRKRRSGLVPSSQLMRLMIAYKMDEWREQEREKKNK